MSGGVAGEKQAASGAAEKGERVAKVIARSGFCSRRDAERLIAAGRVAVNGRTLATPAVVLHPQDRVEIDGALLAPRERTRLWLFHKPKGLVTTNRDPEGRPTVFSRLPAELPRVVTVGRLDLNTEGLLLLTNDGGLARILELPATGWLRRYRVRAHGQIDQKALDGLRHGLTVDGIVYGAVEATVDRVQGSNVWLNVGLREGKNREVKRVLEHLGLSVGRLIRVSYGPFQLGEMKPGEVAEVRGRVLRDQLGDKLTRAAGADFAAPVRPPAIAAQPDAKPARSPRRRDAHRRRSP
jgi:23S rRNA pseudouridine2605 synthase